MKLESHGIQTNLPPGWEGRIAVRRNAEAVPGGDGPAAPSAAAFDPDHHVSAGGVTTRGHATEANFPVVHLGNFPLPGDRGDFGSGAVDLMTDLDVLLVLAEYGPECANTALFNHQGVPTRLTPAMFSTSALQRTLPGQAGCQVWFSAQDRAFCLYAVLGRQSNAPRVLPSAIETLAATRIQPR